MYWHVFFVTRINNAATIRIVNAVIKAMIVQRKKVTRKVISGVTKVIARTLGILDNQKPVKNSQVLKAEIWTAAKAQPKRARANAVQVLRVVNDKLYI